MKKWFSIAIAILLLIGCTGSPVPQDPSDIGGTETDPELAYDRDAAVRPTATLVIEANGRIVYADPEDNPSAKAFIERLNSEAIDVDMHDSGNAEKVGSLPWELAGSDERIAARPGDVILYRGNQIAICCGESSMEGVLLARIGGDVKNGLPTVLGEGTVTVSFRLEWSE